MDALIDSLSFDLATVLFTFSAVEQQMHICQHQEMHVYDRTLKVGLEYFTVRVTLIWCDDNMGLM